MKLKDTCSLEKKAMTNLHSILKSRDIIFLTNVYIVKGMVFPVVMYRHESWTIKKAEHRRIDAFKLAVLEKTLESSLDRKEIKWVNPKGNQPWILNGRTDAKAKAPIFWPTDMKGWLTGKYSDAEKDWCQEEKGVTEDEMVEWHHQLPEHEFQQTPGDSEGQGSLVCCSSWGCKELDTS